ncbi:MAG: hypothetical protein M3O50_13340, partial [Myxococcota bacterium]|nr:hypothetical protein [Myxococcota bacterium]
MDPLRAGHVAILEGAFRYFCRSDCKQAYLRSHGRHPEEDVPTAAPPAVSPTTSDADRPAPSGARPRLTSAASVASWALASSTLAQNDVSSSTSLRNAPLLSAARGDGDDESPPAASATDRRGAAQASDHAAVVAVLDAAGIAFGVLVPAIGLLGPAVDAARVALAIASWAALALRVGLVPRDDADPHPLVVLVPTGGAVGAAFCAWATHDPRAVAIAVLAGLSSAVALAVERLVGRARIGVSKSRERIEQALDVRARTVQAAAETVELSASEVRAGEQILVEAGELVGVDAVVVAGEARVIPWLDATEEVTRRDGDPVVAGARVVSSRLRLTTTWSGRDRAWVKLLSSPETRIDVAAPTARALRLVVERGAPVAALLV